MKFDVIGEDIKIYDFNALQAYKIGRHLEIEGIDFYNNLILCYGNNINLTVKDGIEFLLQEEKKHLQLLEKKIEEITAQEEDGFEEEDLEDFINTRVFVNFNNLRERKGSFHNIQETIEFGIMIENRAIMFYRALLEHIEDKSGRNAVNELILEEMDHLRKLNTLNKSVNS